MRLLHIAIINFQDAFESRMRSVVWFLTSLFNPLIFLLFWYSADRSHDASVSLPNLTAYYFLLIIAAALLMSHTQEDVAEVDIKEGNLVSYLLRPISYFQMKFFEEIPYRIIQGSLGLITFLTLFVIFKNIFTFTTSPLILLLSVIIAMQAYLLSFTMKMILGSIAFWVIDIRGVFQVFDMITWIFAGYVVPLNIFPQPLQQIAYALPFSYIIYFPITAFQGKLNFLQLVEIIAMQLIWIALLFGLYQFMWRKGVRKFTGVGQ